MAQTATVIALSGSTNGRPIKVVQTATAGTTIHTAQTGTAGKDLITLYANNTSSSAVLLTIEFGGVASPDDHIKVNLPPQDGLALIALKLPLNNSLVVKAFAATANVINITGSVIRVTD